MLITLMQTSGRLWQYYRDGPALGNNNIINFPANYNNNISFKSKQEIQGKQEAVTQKMLKQWYH